MDQVAVIVLREEVVKQYSRLSKITDDPKMIGVTTLVHKTVFL